MWQYIDTMVECGVVILCSMSIEVSKWLMMHVLHDILIMFKSNLEA